MVRRSRVKTSRGNPRREVLTPAGLVSGVREIHVVYENDWKEELNSGSKSLYISVNVSTFTPRALRRSGVSRGSVRAQESSFASSSPSLYHAGFPSE